MKGLRTMLFNAAVAALTAGVAMIDPTVVAEFLGSYGYIAVPAYGIINMILRSLTNTPVLRKE